MTQIQLNNEDFEIYNSDILNINRKINLSTLPIFYIIGIILLLVLFFDNSHSLSFIGISILLALNLYIIFDVYNTNKTNLNEIQIENDDLKEDLMLNLMFIDLSEKGLLFIKNAGQQKLQFTWDDYKGYLLGSNYILLLAIRNDVQRLLLMPSMFENISDFLIYKEVIKKKLPLYTFPT